MFESFVRTLVGKFQDYDVLLLSYIDLKLISVFKNPQSRISNNKKSFQFILPAYVGEFLNHFVLSTLLRHICDWVD
jgi:hypothetical protein